MGAAVQVIRVNSSPMSVVKAGTVSPPAGCLLAPMLGHRQDALACLKSADFLLQKSVETGLEP